MVACYRKYILIFPRILPSDRYLYNVQLWTYFVSSLPLPVSGEMPLRYIDVHGHYERLDVH